MDERGVTREADNLLITGIIRTSHGLDGFVKVESSSGEVDHFADLSEIFARQPGSNKEEKLLRLFIEAVEGSSSLLLIKFKGIDSPEQAKKLAGFELLVPRDKACPLNEGEYYVGDLCQCALVYNGCPIGTIIGVMEGGADDLLEVILTDGSDLDESRPIKRLVPLRKEFVGKIDISGRTVELMHRWILE